MISDLDPTKWLAEAAERLKREAFAAGWRAAMQSVSKALDEVAEPPEVENIAIGGAGSSGGTSRAAGVSANVTVGSTPYYVLQAITARPGMSGSEIVNAVQAAGHEVPEGSIRTSIARLKKRKLIVARHGKWFLP